MNGATRLAVLVVWCSARSFAHAQPAPERIQLSYDAVDGCPDKPAVIAQIAEHARVTVVDGRDQRPAGSAAAGRRGSIDDPQARRFAITIVAEVNGLRGALAVATSGTTATREVHGATCDEVVSAIALVAALAIEEQALPPIERHVVVVPPARSRWRFAAGSGVALFSGMTPTARFGAPVFVAMDRDRGPRLRVAFDVTARDDESMMAGTTAFRWTAGRLDGCPIAWAWGPAELAPCVGFEGGVLAARGVQVDNAAAGSRPWLAPDAILRLGLRFGGFALEAEGSAGAPLVRDRFVIGPTVTVYAVPAITTNVALTLAIDVL